MSYVREIYTVGVKIKEILQRKSFKAVFIGISSVFLFFGVMNAYAQKVEPAWDETQIYYNLSTGLPSDKQDEDNMTSHSGQLGVNTAWITFSTLAPELTVGGDSIESSADIPDIMKGGVLGLTKTAYAFLYQNQPNINVVAHLGNEWVPGYKESATGTYAAENSGYDTLMDSGISGIWSKMRDIAYLFFVVTMIVIGFMIMFRSKIGGQTMVSLGNTIPSIIVSLILVTFSFAIAGLIIDIGGVLVNVLYGLFEEKSIHIGGLLSLFGVYNGFGTDAVNVIKDNFVDSLQNLISSPGQFLIGLFSVNPAAEAVAASLLVLVLLIIGIGIVLVGAIKLLITLVKAYFEILLNVILGPIKILIGTFPGNGAMRINWFTGLIRSVLVFPIAYFIVNIPIFLSQAGEIVFKLPDKLTGANLSDVTSLDSVSSGGYLALLISFAIRTFVIYYACQAPKFAEVLIPVKETNKATADAMAGAKMGMSKIPLVGGLFK